METPAAAILVWVVLLAALVGLFLLCVVVVTYLYSDDLEEDS